VSTLLGSPLVETTAMDRSRTFIVVHSGRAPPSETGLQRIENKALPARLQISLKR
jgi:hypothetical protein